MLQAAVREAREWKAKALAFQKAAEQLKEKAQTLKERAQLALDGNKDLTVSMRQLRKRAQDLQGLAQRLATDKDALAKRLDESESEKVSLRNNLSAVEQQLALYQRAIEELNQGSQREDILYALRAAMTEPGLEEELREKLRFAEEEKEVLAGEKTSIESEKETVEIELDRTRATLESQEELVRRQGQELDQRTLELEEKCLELEKAKLELSDTVEKLDQLRLEHEQLNDANLSLQTAAEELEEAQKELDDRSQELESTCQQLEEAEQAQESSRQELEKALQELQEKKQELETHESDTQSLVEELYREAETLRAEIEFLATEKLELEQALDIERSKAPAAPSEDLAAKVKEMELQITRLEDERSDLEIVNIDLLQQLSETESELERLKGSQS